MILDTYDLVNVAIIDGSHQVCLVFDGFNFPRSDLLCSIIKLLPKNHFWA
jgi:hypothetical protein